MKTSIYHKVYKGSSDHDENVPLFPPDQAHVGAKPYQFCESDSGGTCQSCDWQLLLI